MTNIKTILTDLLLKRICSCDYDYDDDDWVGKKYETIFQREFKSSNIFIILSDLIVQQ